MQLNKHQKPKQKTVDIQKEQLNALGKLTRKAKKAKNKKIKKNYLKLDKWNKSKHIHFDMLIVGSVGCLLLIIFGIVLLFSPQFITSGTIIPQSQFFNPYVNETAITSASSETKVYAFYFGIYQYIFSIEPVNGSSLTSLFDVNALPKILQTFIGPKLNWYGLTFIIFEFFILIFVISAFITFMRYNTFLKYTKEGKKIRKYFRTSYALLIFYIVFVCLVAELNFIPGADLIHALIVKFAPQYAYPAVKYNSHFNSAISGEISKEAKKYINDLSVGGAGVSVPVSIFSYLSLKVVAIKNQDCFIILFHTQWYAWIFVGIYLFFVTSLTTILARMKHKYLIYNLIVLRLLKNASNYLSNISSIK